MKITILITEYTITILLLQFERHPIIELDSQLLYHGQIVTAIDKPEKCGIETVRMSPFSTDLV